jgi:hypothetical protein
MKHLVEGVRHGPRGTNIMLRTMSPELFTGIKEGDVVDVVVLAEQAPVPAAPVQAALTGEAAHAILGEHLENALQNGAASVS